MSGGERQYVVDRLRGFALLGILLVNMPFLVISLNGLDDASMPTFLDRFAGFVVVALFQAKSYVVFSFLFGYGLAIMLQRVEARGGSGTATYLRRLLGLLVFGVAHAILLFPGDILVMYAIFGLLLIPLRRRSDRTLLTAAAAFLALQVVLLVAVAVNPAADDAGLAAAFDHSMSSDSFLDTVVSRASAWPYALGLVGFLQGFLVVGLFLVGLVCGRQGLLADPSQHLETWRRVRRLGLGIGLPVQLLAGLLFVWPGSDDHPGRLGLSLLLNYATAPILSAGYIAAIALLPRRGLTRSRTTCLVRNRQAGPLGRFAEPPLQSPLGWSRLDYADRCSRTWRDRRTVTCSGRVSRLRPSGRCPQAHSKEPAPVEADRRQRPRFRIRSRCNGRRSDSRARRRRGPHLSVTRERRPGPQRVLSAD